MELDPQGRREVVEVLDENARRVIAVRLVRVGEAQHALAIDGRREDEGARREAAGRLVGQAVVVGLVAFEGLVLPGVAAAGRQADLVGDVEVQVGVHRLRSGVQVVGPVDHQKGAGEGHIVVQVAPFAEVVGAQHIVQTVVDGLADQLELLRELVLRQVEGGLQDVARGAIQIHPDPPVQLAISGDGLERGAGPELQVDRARDAPVGQLREVVAGRISGVDRVGGDEAGIIRQAVVVRIAVGIGAGQRRQGLHRRRHRTDIQARAEAERALGGQVRRHADAGVVEIAELAGGAGVDREHRVRRRLLIDVQIVAGEGDLQVVRGQEQRLAAHAPGILAALPLAGRVAGRRLALVAVHDVGARGSRRQGVAVDDPRVAGDGIGERNAALPAVAVDLREGDAGQQLVVDRQVGRAAHVQAAERAGGDLALEHVLRAGIARDDRDGAADGIAPEQGALRPLQHLHPGDVQHAGVRTDAAGQIDAVHIDADAGVLVEGEVVLADAADIGSQHRVRSRERRARVQRNVGRDVAQAGDVMDALGLQGLGGHRGHCDRHVLNVLGGLLRRDDDFLDGVGGLRAGGACHDCRRREGQGGGRDETES